MNWQVQSVILLAELAGGTVLFRFFIPFFRRVKTGKFDLYIGDRFKKDGSEPKFAGLVMALIMVLGLTVGMVGRSFFNEGETAGDTDLPVFAASAAVVLFVTADGLVRDYNSETKRGIGPKRRWVILWRWALCFGYCCLLGHLDVLDTRLLLPFHMGNVEFGFIFYPLTAGFMTVIIGLAELHDCPGGVTDQGCDGLCALSSMMFCLGSAGACGLYPRLEIPQIFSVVTAGACGAYLVWGISPSKMYLGRSGSSLLGVCIAVITVTTNMPLAFLCSGIVFIADGVCTLVGRLVFKRRKQLLFKGLTLHGHLTNRGWSDYRIMGVSALMTLLGAVGTFVYASYADSILLNK